MQNVLLLSFHAETNLVSLAIVTLKKGFKSFVEDKEVGLICFRFLPAEDAFIAIS